MLKVGTYYSRNEMGQITEYKLGPSHLKTIKIYNSYFELIGIKTQKINNTSIFNYSYYFKHNKGNLDSCKNNLQNLKEIFGYDAQNRLTTWESYDIANNNQLLYSNGNTYSANGNIEYKSDAGTYSYDNNKPHAVTEIEDDANDPLISLNTQQLTYNPFQKTATIKQGNYLYSITYGTDMQRKKTVLKENENLVAVRTYSGLYEKERTFTSAGAIEKEYHYIPTPSGTVAVHIRKDGNSGGETYFLLKDYLGSVMKVVDNQGSTIEEHSYDPWGNHRDPISLKLEDFSSSYGLNRGYTGHEMIPQFQLINMNGRMYDPIIGRMLSPDNYVVDPSNAQDYNRYSYARGNPLKYTDPSGESVAAAIIIGACAIVGAYIGGAASNGWQMNPAKWDPSSGKTWAGLGIGALVGAAAGVGIVYGGPALAGTAFFSYFGTSGTIVAYGLVGCVSLGAAGYITGVAGGLMYSNGDWAYAHQSGLNGLTIGSIAGSIIGSLYGGYEAYVEYIQRLRDYEPQKLSYRQKSRFMKNELKSDVREHISSGVYRNTPVRVCANISDYAQAVPGNFNREFYTDFRGNKFRGSSSKILIHPDVLDMYFMGDKNEAIGIYLHEWFHVADYYTGYAEYIYTILGNKGGPFLEMRVINKVNNANPELIGPIQGWNYWHYFYQFYFPLINFGF